jgi:hypothetical protein
MSIRHDTDFFRDSRDWLRLVFASLEQGAFFKMLKVIRKVMASPGFAVSRDYCASNTAAAAVAAAAAAALLPAGLRER